VVYKIYIKAQSSAFTGLFRSSVSYLYIDIRKKV